MYEGQLLSAFISEEVPLGTLVTSHWLVLKTHHTIQTILFLSSFKLHFKPTRKRTKRLAEQQRFFAVYHVFLKNVFSFFVAEEIL